MYRFCYFALSTSHYLCILSPTPHPDREKKRKEKNAINLSPNNAFNDLFVAAAVVAVFVLFCFSRFVLLCIAVA